MCFKSSLQASPFDILIPVACVDGFHFLSKLKSDPASSSNLPGANSGPIVPANGTSIVFNAGHTVIIKAEFKCIKFDQKVLIYQLRLYDVDC